MEDDQRTHQGEYATEEDCRRGHAVAIALNHTIVAMGGNVQWLHLMIAMGFLLGHKMQCHPEDSLDDCLKTVQSAALHYMTLHNETVN